MLKINKKDYGAGWSSIVEVGLQPMAAPIFSSTSGPYYFRTVTQSHCTTHHYPTTTVIITFRKCQHTHTHTHTLLI